MEEKRSQKLQLVAEIHSLLEAGDKPLAPAARKAVRLAKLCGDVENRFLLQLHLDGVSAEGEAGFRGEVWPDPSIPPRWDIRAAFRQDRMVDGGKLLALPLEQVEAMSLKLKQEIAELSSKGSYSATTSSLKMELHASLVITRIRNRIANFVCQVEADLYPGTDQVELTKPKDMENGAMGSNVTKIIVALISACGLIVVGYWQFGPKAVPDAVSELYVGRVTDVANNEPISFAKVSVEADQNVPQVHKADSEGVFRLSLRPKTQSVLIRVEGEGYETLERIVSVQRTGLEPVGLKRKPPASPSPTPTPVRTKESIGNKGGSAAGNDFEKRKERARWALRNPSPKP